MTLIVLEHEPNVDLFRTLGIDCDGEAAVLSDITEDAAGCQYVTVSWPVEHIPAICAALMRLWREAQQ